MVALICRGRDGWRHSHERRVIAHAHGVQYTALRQDGRHIHQEKSGSVIVADPDEHIALSHEEDGSFRVRNERNETEHCDSSGRLIAIHGPDYVLALSYDAWDRLLSVRLQAPSTRRPTP